MDNPWRSLRELPRPLHVLAAATLINRAGSMVVVLLALYLTRGAGLSAEFAGVVISLYGATALVASPVVGKLCDRFGASRVAPTLLLLSGVTMLLFPWVRSPAAIVAATVVLSAFTDGFRPAVATLIGEIAPPDKRRMAFALNRLAANLGMSMGPAVGGLLATIWFPAVFIVDGITSMAAGAVMLLALRVEPRRRATARSTAREERDAPRRRAFTDPAMLYFLAAHLGLVLVFFQFIATLPLYMVQDLGLSEADYGLVFTVNTVLILALEVPLTAAITRWSARRVLTLGALLTAVGFGATGLATGFWTLMATVVVWTFGEMIGAPAASAYVADIAPPKRTGEYMGLFNMVFSAGFSLAPLGGVLLLERWGGSVLWTVVLLSGLISAGMLLFLRSPPGARPTEHDDAPDVDAPPPSSQPLGP
ncbi:MAG: MFS transporter [Deltaproteobacteria bacterium]|jgi:predicted MFS family arabinose efflux permease|nr:MFS transporter [Deltaproteobacteria bacterium]MBW2530867.1 MFS transporter [Deltaproteobacteria bacterium]